LKKSNHQHTWRICFFSIGGRQFLEGNPHGIQALKAVGNLSPFQLRSTRRISDEGIKSPIIFGFAALAS
jgi:hypothetical protein